jgi:hypothetical protein
MAAAGADCGRLRASHADRDHVIGMLKAAFVQGRLTKDELDARAERAFAARTYADLAALTADLPTGLADAMPPRHEARAHARPPMSNAAKVGICVVIAVAVAVVVSIPTGGAAFFVFAPFYFMALLVAGAQILASRHEKRSRRGQLPPRPIQGGQAVEGGQSGQPGDNRILCQARRGVGARHLAGVTLSRRTLRPQPVREDPRGSANLQVTA